MILGSLCGLAAYWGIGWFVASLVGAAVSGVVFAIVTWLVPERYDFAQLSAVESPVGDALQSSEVPAYYPPGGI